MRIYEVKVTQEFKATADQVWEAMNDHVTFGKIMGQKITCIIDSTDLNNINGVGSVRAFKLPTLVEETIVKSERGMGIEYKITKGTPLHHHYGRIRFTDLPQGRSSIDYTIELGSKIPFVATLIKTLLQNGIKKGLDNYARRLEK